MPQTEIYHFKIFKADATLNDLKHPEKGMVVRLFYPSNQEDVHGRFPETPESLRFGIDSLDMLLNEGNADIANLRNPIKPAAAGSLYVLNDGAIICHRRDRFAPTHKMYHSAYAGYTHSREFCFTAEGLIDTGRRETAEEVLVMTNEKNPALIIPKDSKKYTLESARRIGIDLSKVRTIDVEIEELKPVDRLEVYNEETGALIYSVDAFLDILRESQTSLNALQIRRLPFSSSEVLPIDAEGMPHNGNWKWFNRESYIIGLEELVGKPFGSALDNPRVFQTRINNGIPEIYAPEYGPPYLGPGIELVMKQGIPQQGIRDTVEVTDPHIWAPENLLVTCLDGLGVDGYKGRKLQIERWKEVCALSGKHFLPSGVLVSESNLR